MQNNTISYPYLSGFLEQTLRSFPNVLEREGIVGWNSKEYKKVMALVDKEIMRAHQAEREHSEKMK